MTDRERMIAAIAAGIALLALLFPPWQGTARFGSKTNLGYHFIMMASQFGQIDSARLIIELVAIGGIALGAAKLIPRG